MFGKVQEDSFQSIFDLSFDSDDNSSKCVIGSNRIKHNSNSTKMENSISSPALLKIKSFGGLHLDLDDQNSCWRSTDLLLSPQEDLFSPDDNDAFFFSINSNKKGSKMAKKLGSSGILMTISDDCNSSASSTCSNSSNTNNKVNTSRYKTELCRPFQENGSCKYGEKCQFAHGQFELRSVLRHPKYKTDLCRTYHSVGFCPYGPRCHFIHSLDEQDTNNNSNNKNNNNQGKSIPSTVSSPALSKEFLQATAAAHTPATTTPATATAAMNIKPLPMFAPPERKSCNNDGFIFGVKSSPDLNSLGLVGLGSSSSSSSGVSSSGSLSPNLHAEFEELKLSDSRLPVFSSLIK